MSLPIQVPAADADRRIDPVSFNGRIVVSIGTFLPSWNAMKPSPSPFMIFITYMNRNVREYIHSYHCLVVISRHHCVHHVCQYYTGVYFLKLCYSVLLDVFMINIKYKALVLIQLLFKIKPAFIKVILYGN